MYVPRVPSLNDPYDREWLVIVGIFFVLLVAVGVLNVVIGMLLF